MITKLIIKLCDHKILQKKTKKDNLSMNNNADSLQPVENNFGFNDHSYHDLVLLRETSNSRLYRIKRTGKQFIIKTPINNST